MDDEAFGKKGWLPTKDQIGIAALAMERGFGKATDITVSHVHNGSVGLNVRAKLNNIKERLPERITKDITPVVEELEQTTETIEQTTETIEQTTETIEQTTVGGGR